MKLDCVLITELLTRERHGMHTHSCYLTKYKIDWLSQPFFQLCINDVGSSNFLVSLEDQEKTGFGFVSILLHAIWAIGHQGHFKG